MPGDVSQFVQLQRLRSNQARQPSSQDKRISHLSQKQIFSSGITEFLPNIKEKNTSSIGIQRYNYVPGIQAKPKIPGGYVWGYDVNTAAISPLQRSVNKLLDGFTNIADANSFFSALNSLLKTAPQSLVLVTTPTLKAYYSSLGIPNIPSIIYAVGGTLFQTHFLTYMATVSSSSNPGGIIIPSAYPITVAGDTYQANGPPLNTLTKTNLASGTVTTINAGSSFTIGILSFIFLGAGSPGLFSFYPTPLVAETAESTHQAYIDSIKFATVNNIVDIGNTVLPDIFNIALRGDFGRGDYIPDPSPDNLGQPWGVYFSIKNVSTDGTITSPPDYFDWAGEIVQDPNPPFTIPGSNIYYIDELFTSLNITPSVTSFYGFIISPKVRDVILSQGKNIIINGIHGVTAPQPTGPNAAGGAKLNPSRVRMVVLELVGGQQYPNIYFEPDLYDPGMD